MKRGKVAAKPPKGGMSLRGGKAAVAIWLEKKIKP